MTAILFVFLVTGASWSPASFLLRAISCLLASELDNVIAISVPAEYVADHNALVSISLELDALEKSFGIYSSDKRAFDSGYEDQDGRLQLGLRLGAQN